MLDVAASFYVLDKAIGWAFLAVMTLLFAAIGACYLIDKMKRKYRGWRTRHDR